VKIDNRQSATALGKIGRVAGLFTAGLLAAIACKSFVIEENVYTGSSSRAGSTSSGGGSTSPGRGGSGGSTSNGTSGADSSSGGELASNGGSVSRGGGSNSTAGSGSNVGGSGGGGTEVEPEIPEEPFTKAGLLRQAADCAVARYKDFEVHALALDAAAKALVAAPNASTASAMNDAWLVANSSWQVAELFRFGPAGRSADLDAGAKELRDQIYGWRAGGRCPVETALVDQTYTKPAFASSLVNIRGLGAGEYLLFYGGLDNECLPASAINKDGAWTALGQAEIESRKRAYAAAVAADILSNTQKLLQDWDPAGGNFRKLLTEPGTGGSPYANEQEALNAVFTGLNYIEKEVKDWKLAIPLGISAECVSGFCPEAVESRYAHVSTANLRQNFVGFRRLFQGCGGKNTGLGFDDWLSAVGAEDLRSRMMAALDNAQAKVDALDPPLEVALTSNIDRVFDVYNALKGLTDLFKTEFISVLALKLPPSGGSDTD